MPYTSIKSIVAEIETLESQIGHQISRHGYEDELRQTFINEALHNLDPQGLKLDHAAKQALAKIDSVAEAETVLRNLYPDFADRATEEVIAAVYFDTEAMIGIWGFDKMIETHGNALGSALRMAMENKELVIKGHYLGGAITYNVRTAVWNLGKMLNRVAGLGVFDCWSEICNARTPEDLAAEFKRVYGLDLRMFKNGKIKVKIGGRAAFAVANAYATYVRRRYNANHQVEA